MFHILLAEDEIPLRKLIKYHLEKRGFSVCESGNGQEALSLLENTEIDLVVADIMMPVMNGDELTRAIKTENADLPVIMLTALSTIGDKKKSFEGGADDYLTKPVDFDELELRIRALLRRYGRVSKQKIQTGNTELDFISKTLKIDSVLIETTKVFDACVSQSTETGIVLPVTDLTPASPATPLTFISAANAPNEPVVISDLVVDRIESCPNYANVSATVTIPVVVNYRDNNGVLGSGRSTITVNKNVVLFVPQPSVTPVNISATAMFSSDIGSATGESTFTVTGCLQVIIRVTAVVDVLVPSYGYPVIPPCHAAPAASACPPYRSSKSSHEVSASNRLKPPIERPEPSPVPSSSSAISTTGQP